MADLLDSSNESLVIKQGKQLWYRFFDMFDPVSSFFILNTKIQNNQTRALKPKIGERDCYVIFIFKCFLCFCDTNTPSWIHIDTCHPKMVLRWPVSMEAISRCNFMVPVDPPPPRLYTNDAHTRHLPPDEPQFYVSCLEYPWNRFVNNTYGRKNAGYCVYSLSDSVKVLTKASTCCILYQMKPGFNKQW